MPSSVEVEATNIVIAGQFNPAIFSPHWLSSVGLIDSFEADSSVVNVIHPDLTSFQCDWFQLIVERERITVNSINAVSIRVYDLVLRLFGDILPHTPLRAFGINYLSHFRVNAQSVLDDLGDTLAPKQPWGHWGATMQQVVTKDHPNFVASAKVRAGGLRSLVMTNYVRPDGLTGHIQAKIEPSLLYRPAVYMEVNDHYELKRGESPIGSSAVLKLVEGKFDESTTRAKDLLQHFMDLSDSFSYERRV